MVPSSMLDIPKTNEMGPTQMLAEEVGEIKEFPHVPRSKRSYTLSTPVYGVGINDADYQVKPTVDGKQLKCPYDVRWKAMLRRCYSAKFHEKYPTYLGCSVTPEWLSFMAFRAWMVTQDWRGKELDKDLITPGNKVYSPGTCMFVSHTINLLMNDHGAARGELPLGVCRNRGKYQVQLSVNGKIKFLGYFTDPQEAHQVYLKAKAAYIRSLLPGLTNEDPRLIPALLRIATELDA